MIVKISKREKNWLYIDNVEKVNIYHLKDYKLAFDEKRDVVCGYKLRLYRKGEKINRNCLFDFDEFLFDQNILLSQIVSTKDELSQEDMDKCWSAKIIEITKHETTTIGVLLFSTTVYLLNNEGKTIERIN